MLEPAGLVEVFLQPGEHFFGDRQTRIRTVLGSCVSLVFWHPRRHIGGMCHYMLPARGTACHPGLDGRYGDEAFELMLAEIAGTHARPQEFRIRLFGGGDMFPALHGNRHGGHIGRKNVEAARRLLHAHGLASTDEHVEGVGHRHLIFDVWNGHILLKLARPVRPAAFEELPSLPCAR